MLNDASIHIVIHKQMPVRLAVDCCLLNPMVQLHIHHLYSTLPACNFSVWIQGYCGNPCQNSIWTTSTYAQSVQTSVVLVWFFFSVSTVWCFHHCQRWDFPFVSANSELWVNSTTALFLCDGDNLEQNIQDLQVVTSSLSNDQILIIQNFESPWKIAVFKRVMEVYFFLFKSPLGCRTTLRKWSVRKNKT